MPQICTYTLNKVSPQTCHKKRTTWNNIETNQFPKLRIIEPYLILILCPVAPFTNMV